MPLKVSSFAVEGSANLEKYATTLNKHKTKMIGLLKRETYLAAKETYEGAKEIFRERRHDRGLATLLSREGYR